MDNLHQSEVRK